MDVTPLLKYQHTTYNEDTRACEAVLNIRLVRETPGSAYHHPEMFPQTEMATKIGNNSKRDIIFVIPVASHASDQTPSKHNNVIITFL